jgi:hypothetical protein
VVQPAELPVGDRIGARPAVGLALSLALQAAVLYVPAMNTLLHTVPITLSSLLPLAALASLVLWVEETRKWNVRRAARLDTHRMA